MQNKLYLCDFGFGLRRYDIGNFSIIEEIDNTGEYKGLGLAFNFDCLAKPRFYAFYKRFLQFLKMENYDCLREKPTKASINGNRSQNLMVTLPPRLPRLARSPTHNALLASTRSLPTFSMLHSLLWKVYVSAMKKPVRRFAAQLRHILVFVLS
jgi:hypothetical protein